ncbi:hypothetical protein GGI35DRAFT_88505 [Trichoderma velutinum]
MATWTNMLRKQTQDKCVNLWVSRVVVTSAARVRCQNMPSVAAAPPSWMESWRRSNDSSEISAQLVQLRLKLYYCVGPIRPLERETFTKLERLLLCGHEWQIAQSCSLGSLVIASFGVVGEPAERQVLQIQPDGLDLYASASGSTHQGVLKQPSAQPDETTAPSSRCLFCLSFKVTIQHRRRVLMRQHLVPDNACQAVKAAAIVNSANQRSQLLCDGQAMNLFPCMRSTWMGEFGNASITACASIGCNPAGSPAYLTRCV